MQKTGLCVLLSMLILGGIGLAQAQDASNALTNPGMEEAGFGQYTGRGRPDLNIPVGWNIWIADGPRDADKPWMNRADKTFGFPHRGPDPSPHGGIMALNVSQGFHTSTNAVFQQVSATSGANVQASAWAWIHTCTLPRDEDGEATVPTCRSSPASEAFVRIGIDPNGGTDPFDSDIVWSANSSPHDQWLQISTTATATGGQVTVFLYYTSRWASDLNSVYWDDAVLSGGGAGGAAAGAATAAPTAPPFVAFVVPQDPQDDGSIVHTVQSGDTIDSIAFAYGVSRNDILDLNNITDARFIAVGQQLLIRPPQENNDEGNASSEDTNGDSSNGESTAEVGPTAVVGTGPTAGPSETPVPTEPPATAPVVSVADGSVLPAIDPASDTASVCVTLFNDVNQNRIQEEGEDLLAGGSVAINSGSEAIGDYETDGTSEPYCFSELAAGDYLAVAGAPDGYGLTTPNQLRLEVYPGATINIAFGAAEGVEAVQPPPADTGGIVNETAAEQTDTRSTTEQILQISGYIIFGMAALVLVGGIGLTLMLRRRP